MPETVERPNIVIIMTDQQRADFMKADGFPLDTMPFTDSLGERGRGVRFRNAYTPAPICSPTRTSMLTGRWPKATHGRQNNPIRELVWRPIPDMVQILKGRGYTTHLVGKNHSHLNDSEFDSAYVGGHGGGSGERSETEQACDTWVKGNFSGRLEPNPYPVQAQFPFRLAREAMAVTDRAGKNPFFLWLSFPEPHNPYQVCEPYYSMFDPADLPERFAGPEESLRRGGKWKWMLDLAQQKEPGNDANWRKVRAIYCAMMRLVDDQIRRFVTHLENTGLLEKTIVVFVSDHGSYVGDFGLYRKGIGMSDMLVRVPMVITGPGIDPCGLRCEEFVSLVDLMPTLVEAAGGEVPYGVQGRSLWPMLQGADFPSAEFRSIYAEDGFGGLDYTGEEEDIPLHFKRDGKWYDSLNAVTQSGLRKMLRMGKWKLVADGMGRRELYDIEADPGELVNRYDDTDLGKVRHAMLEELLYWTIRSDDPLPSGRYVPKTAKRNWERNGS